MNAIKGFTAVDNFPAVPVQVRVLVYYLEGFNCWVVDIQHKNKLDEWYSDIDPFRSTDKKDCLDYYEELKIDEVYTNLVEIIP